MSRTIEQRKNHEGFPKAGELIEFRSSQELTLQDRRILNLLIEHAGPKIASEEEHRIPMAQLRGRRKGGERVCDSIRRLQTTLVEVPTTDSDGNRARRRGQFLSDTVTTDDEENPNGEVRYSFSKTMREVISSSQYWGRLKAYIICSFQSKYAIALYEGLCLRANLQINEQELSVEEFRRLLSVPDDKLKGFPQLKQSAITPAVEEVNAFSDFVVKVEPIRQGGLQRGKLIGFRLSWQRKAKEEWQAALDLLLRWHRAGRRAHRGERIAA